MTSFVKDTLLIAESMQSVIPKPTLSGNVLQAVFLPYYMDPKSSDIMVIMKREIVPGSFSRNGRKMGISALTVELPMDEPLTIDQAFESINKYLNVTLQEGIPYGSVMPQPVNSDMGFELILAHVEPVTMIDEKRGIVYQEKGKFEIGVVPFSDVIEAIQQGLLEDMKTRLILSELYILALNESNKEQNEGTMMSGNPDLIGGGNNISPDMDIEQSETMRTGNIPDDVLEKNSQTDFGSIYANTTPSTKSFTDINPGG